MADRDGVNRRPLVRDPEPPAESGHDLDLSYSYTLFSMDKPDGLLLAG